MALKKLKEFDNGTSGEYWVVQSMNDKHVDKTNVLILLYKDEAARDAGKQFMLRENLGQMDGSYLSGSDVYAWVKRSIMSEAKGVEGEEGYEAPTETNWFFDSEDL
jgi:hypothetical protein